MDHWGPLPLVALDDQAGSFAPTLMITSSGVPAVAPSWKAAAASSLTLGTTTVGTASP
jgi:hypothetical protein